MIIKMMTIYGYLLSWIILYILFSNSLWGLVKKVDKRKSEKDVYMQGMLKLQAMKIVIFIVVIITLLSLIIDYNEWFWKSMGLILTFGYSIILTYMLKLSEGIEDYKLSDKEEDEVKKLGMAKIQKKDREKKIEYVFVVILNISLFVVMALNAWDIIPIREKVFPMMMPIYMHMAFNILQFLFIILINFLNLVIMKEWMVYRKMIYKLQGDI